MMIIDTGLLFSGTLYINTESLSKETPKTSGQFPHTHKSEY